MCVARHCYSKSSARLSVYLFVCDVDVSYMLGYSLKVSTKIISLESSLFGDPTSVILSKRNTQNSDEIGVGCCCHQKTCNISETGQDRTKVTIDD